MSSRLRTRRGYETLEAVNPEDGSTYGVFISHDRIEWTAKQGMGRAKELAFVVPSILKWPTAIFEGLCEDADEDKRGFGWRCYVGIPSVAFRNDDVGSERGPYADEVYLVFVNDDGVIYNYRWEKCEPESPEMPIRYETRFKKRVL